MKIEIDISEIVKTPVFISAIADYVANRMFDDVVENEWRSAFTKELEKELEQKVKDTVDGWLALEDSRIKEIIKKRFSSLTNSEIVELVKLNKLSF